MAIAGIEQVDGGGKPNISEVESTSSSGSDECSREKVLNVVLIIMVFVLLGLFAYLFFTDRLVVGIENPLSKGTNQEEVVEYCTYEGVQYSNGESFPSNDGCNTCSCTNGEVVCTLMACEQNSCIDSEEQCIGKEDGTECEMGIICDENGEETLSEGFTEPIPGTCLDEVCTYLPD